MQLLEIALVDGTIKETDVSHPSINLLIDLLKSITLRNENIELQDHIECILQGIHVFLFLCILFHDLVAKFLKPLYSF